MQNNLFSLQRQILTLNWQVLLSSMCCVLLLCECAKTDNYSYCIWKAGENDILYHTIFIEPSVSELSVERCLSNTEFKGCISSVCPTVDLLEKRSFHCFTHKGNNNRYKSGSRTATEQNTSSTCHGIVTQSSKKAAPVHPFPSNEWACSLSQ